MARKKGSGRTEQRVELLGIRVTASRKTEVKVEAARRGVTIAELFDEIWRNYLEGKNAGGRQA
jgi:hypothetical protein